MGDVEDRAALQRRIEEALRAPSATRRGFSQYEDTWSGYVAALQAASEKDGVDGALDAFDALLPRADPASLRYALVIWLASSHQARRLGLRAPAPGPGPRSTPAPSREETPPP